MEAAWSFETGPPLFFYMTTQLSEIQTDEVSLVGKGANRKRFLLFKSEEGNMEELIKDLLEATKKFDGEEDLEKELKKHDLSEGEISIVKGAIRLFNSVTDKVAKSGVQIVLPGQKKPEQVDKSAVTVEFLKAAKPEGREAIAKALGIDPAKFTLAFNGKEDPNKNKDGIIIKADGTLDLEQVPENMRPVVQALWKGKQDSETELKTAKEKIEKAEKEKIRKEWITKAEEFKDLPGVNVDELADSLMRLDASDHEAAEKHIKMLKSNKEVIEKGNLFGELGSRHDGPLPDSATAKVQQLAKGLIEKSDKDAKLTEADAIAKVLNEHPEYYSQYRQENTFKV